MNPVLSLLLATAGFVGTHLLMSHPLRAGLVARLGERGFQGVYSLVSILFFLWMILAWRGAVPGAGGGAVLWHAPLWWWHVAAWLMIGPSVLLMGSLIGNPAMVSAPAASAMKPALGVYAVTRHPMMWAFMLWAVVHVTVYGSARNLIVAFGIFTLALAGSLGQDRKKEQLLGDSWRGWEARTSYVPFAALVSGKIPWRALLPGWPALLAGLVLWAAATWWHAPLFVPWGRSFGPVPQ